MAGTLKAVPSTVVHEGVRSRGYQEVREVRARAAATEKVDSPELKKALSRLDQMLASGRPVGDEVPRGYYFNFRV